MTHASLFSGIGGPEVAAAMLGWENLFHCEINPFGRAVLEYWFPDSESYEDIFKCDFRKWRGRVDVLTGGFPCQPFSYAGKRGGANDDRYLWPQMLRAIDEIRPAWVVGENVAGLATMVEGGVLSNLGCDAPLFPEGDDVHRYELAQTFTIERICGDFEGIGYSVQPVLIPAAAVGAPHLRNRIFFLASISDAAEQPRNVGPDGRRESYKNGSGQSGECRIPYASDTDRRRSPSLSPQIYAGIADGDRTALACRKWSSSNANGKGLQESISGRIGKADAEGAPRLHDRTKRSRGGGCLASPWEYDDRLEWMPTISPICRGNDGLPFPLDDLTIPATKWRNESLKAYGNAIVPQVMYRIFQAIEEANGK